MAKRSTNKLTALTVERAKTRGRLGDGGGLWLNVTSNGAKSWVFRWVVNGKASEMGLGPYPVVTLAQAREAALDCRRHVFSGKNPRLERGKIRETNDLRLVATRYLEEMSSRWTNEKTRWQWQKSLTDQIACIASVAITDVSTEHIMKALKPIWEVTPEAASRLRMRLEAVLDYACAKGMRSGDNPARWKGHLEHLLPAKKGLVRGHHTAIAYQDIPELMDKLRTLESLAAIALRFTILTAARTGEVLKATESEFDLVTELWTIPAWRMKMKNEHRVPLCREAAEIVDKIISNGVTDFVFPGQNLKKPLSNTAMTMLLRRLGYTNITVHGMRSAFRDWCGDETEVSREIAEAALAHRVGNSVELAYRRGDALEKRRELMHAWGRYCSKNVGA